MIIKFVILSLFQKVNLVHIYNVKIYMKMFTLC